MSRNLLMNNLPENGVIPVTKGLICWLDGRDGSGQDTVWRGRSRNGNDFELRGFTFSDDDGWTGNNLKVNFEQVAIKENFSLPEEYTIEVDMFVDGTKNGQYTTFFYFGDGNTSGMWREIVFRKASHVLASDLKVINANFQQIVQQYPNCLKRYNLIIQGTRNKIYLYVDNVQIYDLIYRNVVSGITSIFHLGCAYNFNSYCKARFNSVRVYNRILTEEEINHNYRYDQSIERSDS